jgi:hypothetical protein
MGICLISKFILHPLFLLLDSELELPTSIPRNVMEIINLDDLNAWL